MVDKEELGASLFSRSLDIMENDPLEEIFALNMGDFVSEFLISEELATKIGKSAKESNAFLMQNNLITTMIKQNIENQLCFIKYLTKYLLKTYFSLSKETFSS